MGDDRHHARVGQYAVGEPLEGAPADVYAGRQAIAERLDDVAARERGLIRREPVGAEQLARDVGDDRLIELDATGALVWDLELPRGYDSYRAYRQPWAGTPDTRPRVRADEAEARRILSALR